VEEDEGALASSLDFSPGFWLWQAASMVMTKKTAEIALNIFIGDSLKQVIKSGAKLGTQFIFPIFFRGLIPYRLIQIILYFLEKKKGTEYLKMGSGQPIAFVINKLRNDRRRAKAKIGKYSLCPWLCWHPGTEY